MPATTLLSLYDRRDETRQHWSAKNVFYDEEEENLIMLEYDVAKKVKKSPAKEEEE